MKPTTRASGAAIAATLLALTAPAGVAHASEAGYLARLGVDYDMMLTDETIPAALRAGYVLCDEMRAGTSPERLAQSVYWTLPNATREQSEGMAYAAQVELCPETGE